MQISIYLTIRQGGITSISTAASLADIPLEDLEKHAAMGGLHVGFQNFAWNFEQLSSGHPEVPRLWLTEAAHAVLGPMVDPAFFRTVWITEGRNFYEIRRALIPHFRERFRPQASLDRGAGSDSIETRHPRLDHPDEPSEQALSSPAKDTPANSPRDAFEFLRGAADGVLETPVANAGFSNRVKRVFSARGIERVRDLVGMTEDEMLAWDNFGRTSVKNVEETLHSLMSRTEAAPWNWIKTLGTEHPALFQQLLDAGIHTDTEYLASEAAIPAFEARVLIAELRFKFLTDGQNVTRDPGLVVRACPPWVQSRDIEGLTLPGSCSKRLLTNGVRKVADLINLRPETMLRWPAFGKSTLEDACLWITRSIQDGPTDKESLLSRYGKGLVKDWINGEFEALGRLDPAILPERAADILNERCLGKTLQQLGDAMDPPRTRERVRQLETIALSAFKKRSLWKELLAERLDQIFTAAAGPVYTPSLPKLDVVFEGVTQLGDKFPWVLEHVLPSPVFLISCADFQSEIIARIPPKEWISAVHSGRELLRETVRQKKERPESDLRAVVYSLLPDGAAELRDHLWREVSRRAIFVELDGIRRLRDYGSGNEIVELLENSDSPMHWTEIMKAVEQMPRASVRNRLLELEDVFRFGPGTYGVQKHFRLSREDLRFVAVECRSMALGKMGRQWSCAEFCEELHRADFHLEGRDEPLTPDIINNALRIHGEELGFVNKSRLNWSLGGEAGAAARLQILPECLEILKEHGRPMLVDELRRRLVQTRGLGAFLQLTTFHKDGLTMIRMDARHVGILELHAGPLAQPAGRRQLTQAVHEALVNQQKGLHLSQLASVKGAATLMNEAGLDPILLIDVCRLSDRIRFSRGAYLYLSEWDGDRMHTLAEAIELAFEGVSGGLTNQQLLDKMELLLGRVVSRSEILSTVYKTDVRRDESNTVWIRKRWSDEA